MPDYSSMINIETHLRLVLLLKALPCIISFLMANEVLLTQERTDNRGRRTAKSYV
jgi:hypothetical protein